MDSLQKDVRVNINPPIKNIPLVHQNTKNEDAFKKFKTEHINDPEFKDRFVAFVKGEFQDVGDDELKLIEAMDEKFGDVEMFVDTISKDKKIERLRTPRFID